MHNSTRLSPQTINQQATRHEETGENVNQQLNQLKSNVDSTLASSASAATRALQSTCDAWIESVRSSVLQHLHNMAETIRTEAKAQDSFDQQNGQTIQNLPMDTATFLGAGS